MCDVSEGAYSDKPAENYHPTAQFLSALQSFPFSVFQLFVLDFMACNFTVLVHYHYCHHFIPAGSSFQRTNIDKTKVHLLHHNVEKVSD